jgi:signal transduction histidine kinase
MWAKTLRGRLTLWNLGILSVTLILFGLVLNYTNRQRVIAEIDRDVIQRARQAANPPPPPPDMGDPGGMGGFPGEDRRPRTPPEDNPPPNDPQGYLRRPERFSRDGHLLGRSGRPIFDSGLLAAALKGREVLGDSQLNNVHLRVAAVPTFHNGEIDGVVESARVLTDFDSLWQSQTITLLVLVPLALVVGGLGALFLTNKALQPIARATATASQISDSAMSTRLEVQGHDELAQLSGTFNSMLDRLETAFEKQKSAFAELEKAYENQQRFTADASHELRTPLTRLKLATGIALTESGLSSKMIESLQIADQSADAMSKIVNQLLLLSRADAGQLGLVLSLVDLRLIAAEAADAMPKREPAIEVNLPPSPVMVNGDEDHLKRVVLNLLQNAYKNTPEGRKIELSVANGDQAVLKVRDQGIGILPEFIPRLGERFFRVDMARSEDGGVGLGLSICKSIVDAHGGSMEFVSEPEKGTSVSVRLPAREAKLDPKG